MPRHSPFQDEKAFHTRHFRRASRFGKPMSRRARIRLSAATSRHKKEKRKIPRRRLEDDALAGYFRADGRSRRLAAMIAKHYYLMPYSFSHRDIGRMAIKPEAAYILRQQAMRHYRHDCRRLHPSIFAARASQRPDTPSRHD